MLTIAQRWVDLAHRNTAELGDMSGLFALRRALAELDDPDAVLASSNHQRLYVRACAAVDRHVQRLGAFTPVFRFYRHTTNPRRLSLGIHVPNRGTLVEIDQIPLTLVYNQCHVGCHLAAVADYYEFWTTQYPALRAELASPKWRDLYDHGKAYFDDIEARAARVPVHAYRLRLDQSGRAVVDICKQA